jgi:uncharacterized membrane protein
MVLSLAGLRPERDPQLSKENFKDKEKLVTGPDGGLTPGQTGRLTVGTKITLTLICMGYTESLFITLCMAGFLIGQYGKKKRTIFKQANRRLYVCVATYNKNLQYSYILTFNTIIVLLTSF